VRIEARGNEPDLLAVEGLLMRFLADCEAQGGERARRGLAGSNLKRRLRAAVADRHAGAAGAA
jgi:hypothetical protein